jgi:hypothetical protein
VAVAVSRDHVVADRVVPEVRNVHRVDHLRRHEHRHRGSLAPVALDRLGQVLGEEIAESLPKLVQVLDGVLTLPAGAAPLLLRYICVARDAAPVGFNEVPLGWIVIGLLARVGATGEGGLGRCECHWSSSSLRAGLAVIGTLRHHTG